ncbi:MAG: YbaB/EbfC family nucleoid-associated protein, partial [Venatoribacter sp.]
VNDAVRKIKEKNQSEMGKLTAGLGMPPGMKLPF